MNKAMMTIPPWRRVNSLSQSVHPIVSFEAARTGAFDVVKAATDLPGPLDRREPQTVRLELETVELDGVLADGTTYTYWTFNRTVPGPFLRVREGDTVELVLTNDPTSTTVYSIDLHAVNGPGGGAASTQVKPGETKQFTFKALNFTSTTAPRRTFPPTSPRACTA